MANSLPFRTRIGLALANLIGGDAWRDYFATVTAQVDDSPGWHSYGSGTYDRDQSEIEELYNDALLAWRKNPIAKRAIDITTDYVLGDGITISSHIPDLQNFIDRFLSDPENLESFNFAAMSEELSRSGDLYVVLFRNPTNGMSYTRFVVKPEIIQIETAARDWSKELVYHQRIPNDPGETRRWYSPRDGRSRRAKAVMLHFTVNRPIGALLGESDLATVLPWLLKYSRMVEDRIRLHWASRMFLWFVKVPKNKVAEKRAQYRMPPESGSIIVHDESEEWNQQTPQLNGLDSSFDLEAIRRLIYTGTGLPPHWFGERGSNRAEATEMGAPAERHLKRRQRTFAKMISNIILTAYRRAVDIDKAPPLPDIAEDKLITVTIVEPSRRDAEALAQSAKNMADAYKTINQEMPNQSRRMARLFTRLVLTFAGEGIEEATLDEILEQAFNGSDSVPAKNADTKELTAYANGNHTTTI